MSLGLPSCFLPHGAKMAASLPGIRSTFRQEGVGDPTESALKPGKQEMVHLCIMGKTRSHGPTSQQERLAKSGFKSSFRLLG